MIRKGLQETGFGSEPDFRWRGGEVSRIEGFTDAVLAFAVTLLVVSLEVPKTMSELMEVMRGFFAFAVCFAVLMDVWYNHYLFFRRYGLQDIYSIFLNAVLIFVVLFYVYPLKFLFTAVFQSLFGWGHVDVTPDPDRNVTGAQVTTLFLIYNSGYIAVFGAFALLYAHALKLARVLELNALEILATRERMYAYFANISVAVLSIAIILIGGPRYSGMAGIIYFLIGPLRAIVGTRFGREHRRLKAAMAAAPDA